MRRMREPSRPLAERHYQIGQLTADNSSDHALRARFGQPEGEPARADVEYAGTAANGVVGPVREAVDPLAIDRGMRDDLDVLRSRYAGIHSVVLGTDEARQLHAQLRAGAREEPVVRIGDH